MHYNLLGYLNSFPDPRRGQGQRHPLPIFLAMVIMAIISGHQGLKGFTRFMKGNEKELTLIFQLKHGVPSFGTVRTLLQNLNTEELANKFAKWMEQYFEAGEELWMSSDGKGLKSTVKNPYGSQQSFVNVVSVFAQRSGLVYGMVSIDNGKASEGAAVRQLIEKLGLKEVVFTLDALHCQKKL